MKLLLFILFCSVALAVAFRCNVREGATNNYPLIKPRIRTWGLHRNNGQSDGETQGNNTNQEVVIDNEVDKNFPIIELEFDSPKVVQKMRLTTHQNTEGGKWVVYATNNRASGNKDTILKDIQSKQQYRKHVGSILETSDHKPHRDFMNINIENNNNSFKYYYLSREGRDSDGKGGDGGWLYHIVAKEPDYQYSWRHGDWGSCDRECGGGTQTRPVECKRSDGQNASDSNCSESRPSDRQSCSTNPCYTYDWVEKPWGDCDRECGGGTQTRPVECKRSDGQNASDSNCSESRPSDRQSCSTNPCYTYDWVEKPWGDCDRECGGGTQTRRVECNRNDGRTASDANCRETRPPNNQACNTYPCPQWTHETWGPCISAPDATCGQGTRVRDVTCVDSRGGATSGSQCVGHKPIPQEQCNNGPCPVYELQYGDWSACNEVCGGGTQTRTALCKNMTDMTVANMNECNTPDPSQMQRECMTQPCPEPQPIQPEPQPIQPEPQPIQIPTQSGDMPRAAVEPTTPRFQFIFDGNPKCRLNSSPSKSLNCKPMLNGDVHTNRLNQYYSVYDVTAYGVNRPQCYDNKNRKTASISACENEVGAPKLHCNEFSNTLDGIEPCSGDVNMFTNIPIPTSDFPRDVPYESYVSGSPIPDYARQTPEFEQHLPDGERVDTIADEAIMHHMVGIRYKPTEWRQCTDSNDDNNPMTCQETANGDFQYLGGIKTRDTHCVFTVDGDNRLHKTTKDRCDRWGVTRMSEEEPCSAADHETYVNIPCSSNEVGRRMKEFMGIGASRPRNTNQYEPALSETGGMPMKWSERALDWSEGDFQSRWMNDKSSSKGRDKLSQLFGDSFPQWKNIHGDPVKPVIDEPGMVIPIDVTSQDWKDCETYNTDSARIKSCYIDRVGIMPANSVLNGY